MKIDQIREGENNLRVVNVESVEFKNLMSSIAKHGLLNPISVCEYQEAGDPEKPEEITFDGFRVVDGGHRFYACRKLGMEDIAVNVVDVEDDDDLNMLQIQGNLQRIKTRPHEFAAKLREMQVLRPTKTLAEFAVELSATESFLRERLKLLRLIPHASELVNDGEIKISNATQLASLPEQEQEDWIEDARTADATAFAGRVGQRNKDIQQERMSAKKEAGPTVFEPTAHYRNVADGVAEIEALNNVSNILSAKGITSPTEAAREALKWVLKLDDESVAKQVEENAAKSKKREEDRERKKAGSLQKQKEEYQKKLNDISKKEAALESGVDEDEDENEDDEA